MPDSGSPIVNAAVTAPVSAGPDDRDASRPGYRRRRSREANEEPSSSGQEASVESPEHQLDSLA